MSWRRAIVGGPLRKLIVQDVGDRPELASYVGKSLELIAQEEDKQVVDALIDLERVIGDRSPPLAAASQLDLPRGDIVVSLRTARWKLYPRKALAGDPFATEPPRLSVRLANLARRLRHPFVLFDLENDPPESQDVVADQADAVRSLSRTLETLMASRPFPGKLPTVTVDDATQERLRALGYVE